MGDDAASVAIPIASLLSAGAAMVSGGAGRIVFVSFLETSGAANASFTYFDGAVATQKFMLDFALNPSGSTREGYYDHGIPFLGDLFIGNIVGAGRVITWVVPEDKWALWKADYWLGIEQALLQAGYP